MLRINKKLIEIVFFSILLGLFAFYVLIDDELKMWCDELYGLNVASQASFLKVIEAIRGGCDGPPPLYPLLCHYFRELLHNDALAMRLPSTLGVVMFLYGCGIYVKRTYGPLGAIFALLLASALARPYATEGRGYGLLLGLATLAFLIWVEREKAVNKLIFSLLLAVTLALMVATHYYAIFFLVPVLGVELYKILRGQKFDPTIMIPVVSPFLVILSLADLVLLQHRMTQHFWSPSHISMIRPYFMEHMACPLGAFLFLAAIFSLPPLEELKRTWVFGKVSQDVLTVSTFNEFLFILFALLAPYLCIVVSNFTTHVFVDRYAAWTTFAIVFFGAQLVLARFSAAPLLLGLGVFLMCLVQFRDLRSIEAGAKNFRESAGIFKLLDAGVVPASLPLVIADPHEFLEVSYYSSADTSRRLAYLNDKDTDLKYLGFDTDALIFENLPRYTALNIFRAKEFLKTHNRFVLFDDQRLYVPSLFASQGWTVSSIDPSIGEPRVFLVSKEASP